MAVEIIDSGTVIALFALQNVYTAGDLSAVQLRGKGARAVELVGGITYKVTLDESIGVVGGPQVANVFVTPFVANLVSPESPGVPTVSAGVESSDGVVLDQVVINVIDAVLDTNKLLSLSVLVTRSELPLVQTLPAVEPGP